MAWPSNVLTNQRKDSIVADRENRKHILTRGDQIDWRVFLRNNRRKWNEKKKVTPKHIRISFFSPSFGVVGRGRSSGVHWTIRKKKRRFIIITRSIRNERGGRAQGHVITYHTRNYNLNALVFLPEGRRRRLVVHVINSTTIHNHRGGVVALSLHWASYQNAWLALYTLSIYFSFSFCFLPFSFPSWKKNLKIK